MLPGLRTWWTDRSLNVKGIMVVAIPATMIAAATVMAFVTKGASESSDRQIVHLLDVYAAMRRVYEDALDVESGAHGYSLTHNREFLQPHDQGQERFTADLEGLASMVARDSALASLIPGIRDAVARRITIADRLVAESGAATPAAADQARLSGLLAEDRLSMDQLRTVLGDLAAEVDTLITWATADAASRRAVASIGILVVFALGIAGGALASALYTTGVSRRVRRIGEAAANLQRDEPVEIVAAGKDEVGRLNRVLAEASATLVARQKALNASRHRMEDVLAVSPDLMFMADAEGRFTFANAAALAALGRSSGEVLGKTVRDLGFPRVIAASEAQHGEVLTTGRAGSYQVMDANGERYYDGHIGAVRDGDGQGREVVITLQDVTNRVKAESALRAVSDRLERLIDEAPIAIVSLDTEGRVITWNPGAERLFGWEAREVIGRPWPAVPEDERAVFAARLAAVLAGASQTDVEVTCRRKDGTRIQTSLSVAPLHDSSSEIIGIMGLFVDISERRRLERQFQVVVESAPFAIVMVDPGGTIAMVNAETERIFGYPPDELVGQDVEMLVPPGSRQGHSLLRRAFFVSAGESRMGRGRALKAWRKDGTEVAVEIGLAQIEQAEGFYGLATIVDMSERDRAAAELEASRHETEVASQAKTVFLSRISHELRTPLNAILGFAQLLQLGNLDTEQRDNVRQILHGGTHLLDLVNEVLDVARIESGRLKLSMEPVRVGDVTRECLALMQPAAARRRIRLTTAAVESEVHVHADRQRLKQVLLNLLSNAIKFNREDGTVELTCEADDGTVRVHVRDTGRGIAPELMDRLFRPFERLDLEGNIEVEGTGLGLSLSRRLMEEMGGSIDVRSVKGEGSTFTVVAVRAPCAVAPPPDRAVSVDVAPRASLDALPVQRTRRILAIEDNLSNVRLLERMVTWLPGAELVSAMQGRIGLDLARDHQPDLILLDLHLPDMGGDVVLEQLLGEEATRRIPVVMVSADATPSQANRLLALGASAYVTKPIDVEGLLRLIVSLTTEQRDDQPDGA